jgi:DNA-binding CsgD family transcriptional regulator
MNLSIPSSLPTASYQAPRPTAAAPPPAESKQAPESAPYVIKLTEAEQAYQLSLQEQTVPQIANQLSITVAAVNSYLGISDSA